MNTIEWGAIAHEPETSDEKRRQPDDEGHIDTANSQDLEEKGIHDVGDVDEPAPCRFRTRLHVHDGETT